MDRNVRPDGSLRPVSGVPTATRSAILAAARAEILDSGDFTIRAVAARAGVSRQAIHYHFGDARGLRAALAAEGLEGDAADSLPTRERLLAAAERVLARPGGGLVTMEAIAAEAGLTKGAVYHHFADRAELLSAVAGRVSPVAEILGALESTRDLPIRDALTALATAYYKAMMERADLVRHLAANAARDPELGDVVMGQILGQAAPVVYRWFRDRTAAGELDVPEPSFIIQALFGPVFLRIVLGPTVFARLEAFGVRPATADPAAYVDLLIRGIAGPSAATPASPPTPEAAR
jgi:AcrR family transcriptional regulator